MKKIKIYFISILVLLLSMPEAAISQNVIKGTVKGGPNGDPVPGVTVMILETNISTITNETGEYSIATDTGVYRTVSIGAEQKNFLTVEGTNWMNFWIDPPDLPSDFDGNYYQTLTIGNQIWMKENLKATHFLNGDPIPYNPDYISWPLPEEAYFNYNEEETNGDIYGRLYNWYAMEDERGVCPDGWHVPSYQDYLELFYEMGYDPNLEINPPPLGGMLKEIGTSHWNFPNTGATDEIGFTALPGGEWSGGTYPTPYTYKYLGTKGSFWCSTVFSNPSGVRALTMTYNSADVALDLNPQSSALSIRCVEDNYLPMVSTTVASDITINSAISGGDVISEGFAPVTEAGVCWSTDPEPTTSDNTSADGSGLGPFSSSLTMLDPNTTYYVRAYATNALGTAYGHQISFTTLCPEITLTEVVSNISCFDANDGSIIVTPSGGTEPYTYAWDHGPTTPSISALAPGTYTVTVSDAYNCTNSLSVTLTQPAEVAVSAAVTSDISCQGNSNGAVEAVATGGTGTYTFAWYVDEALTIPINQVTQTATDLSAGTYWVEVTDENGCTASDNVTLTDPAVLSVSVVNITDESCTGCQDGSISVDVSGGTPPYSFIWRGPDDFMTTDEDISNLTAGVYYDTVIDNHECIVFTEATVNNPLIVTNTDDSGYGSLRYAVNYANGRDGADIIIFNIPNGPDPEPHTIQLNSALTIDGDFPLTIDGYSQPGAYPDTDADPSTGFNADLRIELDGSLNNNPGEDQAFFIKSAGCSIRGLVINRFTGRGISVWSDGNLIEGNYIGTNAAGTTTDGFALGHYAIEVDQSDNNIIRANLVSGCGGPLGDPAIIIGMAPDGVKGSNNNLIVGNLMGTDASGTIPLPNTGCGISISVSSDNTVGGLDPEDLNLLYNGVGISGAGAENNKIIGNYIGTDITGETALGSGYGVLITGGAQNNEVGPDNVISGNGNGIRIEGATTSDNLVIGNYIGTDVDGKQIIGNVSNNITIEDSPNNRIGGLAEGDGNIISGSTWDNGISIWGANSKGNHIVGNYIGTNSYSDKMLGNARSGIQITEGATNNTVGPGNVISGNGECGIIVQMQTTIGNRIIGNLVGTTVDGMGPLGNGTHGILMNAPSNLIGGYNVEERNVVSANGYIGIEIGSIIDIHGDTVRGNYIGTDITGNGALFNSAADLALNNTSFNIVGGMENGARNVMGSMGIGNEGAHDNQVMGNYIGLRADGTGPIDAEVLRSGILISDASDNTIGPGNVISGVEYGIYITEYFGVDEVITTNNKIIGNLIGTNANGDGPVSNTEGIRIENVSGIQVGGYLVKERNVISGNDIGVHIFGDDAQSNVVAGNYLGTNKAGTGRISNYNGVRITEGRNNLIGGPEEGALNVISGNTHNGVWIIGTGTADSLGNAVQGNYIGLAANGVDPLGNEAMGVAIRLAGGNLIGGPEDAHRNIVSANGTPNTLNFGIYIELGHPDRGNTVQGNYVGTDVSGMYDVGNISTAIQITNASKNKILENLVSGNGAGIYSYESEDPGQYVTRNNIISRNRVGLKANGTEWLGNDYAGIVVNRGNENLVGGLSPGEGNIVVGSGTIGIRLFDNADGNRVLRNYVGTNSEGEIAMPNNTGISLETGVNNNIVGGNTIAFNELVGIDIGPGVSENHLEGNRIIGNGGEGIYLAGEDNVIGGPNDAYRNMINGPAGGIVIAPDGTGNLIQNNFIGTDETGTKDLAEGEYDGIQIGGTNNVVRDNLVSGYGGDGIDISCQPESGTIPNNNLVEFNSIGLSYSGVDFIPNQNGIFLNSAMNNSIINNEVAGNLQYGIHIIDDAGPTINNRISANSIHDNGMLGINLGTDEVTQNDDVILDPDDGPNNLQNFPVLDSISFSSDDVKVGGFLKSNSDATYIIEFFSSTVGDNSSYGEGTTFLGADTLMTNDIGYVAFVTNIPLAYYSGQVITATAIDQDGNTSEFSQSIGGAMDQLLAMHNPFRYKINNQGLSQYSYEEIETAIRSSFQTWDDVSTADFEFEFAGSTDSTHASATDGINLVSFKDDRYLFSPGVLAVTAKTLRMKPNTAVAEILDADIVFNPKYENHQTTPFAILPEGDTISDDFDIQSVATHEIGHVLGMIHSGVYSAVMFFMLDYGTRGRTLEPDDIAWVSHRYPTEASKASLGYISGRVTYGDDPDPESQPVVAGALVLALGPVIDGTQEQFHAYTDANGYYNIPVLLEAGETNNYWVYIQPLDGDVYGTQLTPRNISPYVYAYTVYTDFPNEFYDFGDAATGDPETGTLVPVLAQNTTRDIDLVTNRDVFNPKVWAVNPADGADDVELVPTITVLFSEKMDLNSFNESTCYFEEDESGLIIGGSYNYLGYVDTAVLVSPIKELDNGKDYTFHVVGMTDEEIDGVTDMKGNELLVSSESGFKTIPDDEIPPEVLDVIPQDEDTLVSVGSTVRVYFSESMDLTSLENGFELLDKAGSEVEGEISWDMVLLEMEFTPDLTLQEGMEYTVRLSSNIITDKAGNPMLEDAVSTFNTVETAAPYLIYLGPTDQEDEVTAGTPVVAIFSEPINTATINGNSFKLQPVGESPVQGEFDFLVDNRTVVFRPDDSLKFDTDYEIILTSDILDVSIPNLSFSGTTTTFHTASGDIVMQIGYLDPPSGVAGNEINIGGTGFDPVFLNNKVIFNTVEAVVTGYDPKFLTVLVPDLATDGPVSVSVNNGEPSNSINFDVLDLNTDPSYDWLSPERTGANTRAVVINPDAGYAYVTNWGSGTVTPINMNNGQMIVESSITVGKAPIDIDINSAGTRVYVTNHYSNSVSVLNVDPDAGKAFNTKIDDIPVGDHPYGVAVSSDDKVYVANNASEYVSVIDVDPASGGFDHVVENLTTGSNNRSIVVPPDAGMVLVTGLDGVKIINRNPESIDFNKVTTAGSGSATRHIALSPDAALAVATTDLGDILIIDIYQPPGVNFGKVIADISTGSSPRNVTIGPDAMYVYISNPEDGTVSIYQLDYSIVPGYGATLHETEGLKFLNTLDVGEKPYALVVDPASTYLLVTHDTEEGGVTKVNIKEESIDPILTLGQLISSVINTIEQELILEKYGARLLEDLQIVRDRIEDGQLASALDNINTFIKRLQRYINTGGVPEDLGNAWLAAAYRIRDQLEKEIEAQKDDLKASGVTGSGTGTSGDNSSEALRDYQKALVLNLEIRPNPFSNLTQINFEVPELEIRDIPVSMRVYNASGQLVKTLVQMHMEPGRYTVLWNGDLDQGGQVPSGLYLLELRIPDHRQTIRISVIR